ncbi:MAG: spermidine synthase [Spirochaetales bacterium]|nr:spermidine synthase [Spirochaetales bacterium]
MSPERAGSGGAGSGGSGGSGGAAGTGGSLRRYLPHLVVFFSSMGVMIIELVASRLVSKYFGSSLYTWTGIIGVVLGGISLGNFLGGRLADRYRPRRLIPWLLLAASLLTFLILLLDLLLYRVLDLGSFAGVTAAMVARSVLLIVVLFFLPSTALGTISPVMAKYALEDSLRVGNTVGSIYAMSAIGSIVGTFLSGFVLIPLLGITTIVVVVGGLLAALALLMGPYRVVSAAWLAAVGLAASLVYTPQRGFALYDAGEGDNRLLFSTDSLYAHIQVRDVPRGARWERQLIQDGLIHNRYDPEAPDELLYEYERIFDALTRERANLLRGAGRGLSTLTLGGGGCVYPSVLQRRYPGSRHEVVEIDPEVLEVAGRYFGLEPGPGLEPVAADARNRVHALASREDGPRYDLVYIDAFNSFSVPYHLTTREFTATLARLLEEDGLLMTNCVDILCLGRFLNAYRNTLREVFPHVAVFHDPAHREESRSTFVLAACRLPLEQGTLRAPDGRVVGYRLAQSHLEELRRRNGPLVLTDSHAPVENLIAPVFLRSVE